MSARKRYRMTSAKPGELKAAWGRGDVRGDPPDLQYAWGGRGASSPDGRILCNALQEAHVFKDRTLVQELEDRGYDITTLKFSIQQKAPPDTAIEGRTP